MKPYLRPGRGTYLLAANGAEASTSHLTQQRPHDEIGGSDIPGRGGGAQPDEVSCTPR